MMRTLPLGAVLLAVLVWSTAGAPPARAADVLLGSGEKNGFYHHVGRSLCRLVNRHAGGISCETLATAGSGFNLSNVSGGALDLGLARSDLHFHAVNGSGPFEFQDIPFGGLRALFAVSGEPFTVVARRDSGIRRLADLEGRRVNIGDPGSPQRATMEAVMKAMGWRRGNFELVEELPAAQQTLALCHDRVQAMVATVSHPNEAIGQTIALCDAFLVEVTGKAVDRLVSGTPWLVPTRIPGELYQGHTRRVPTFGVTTTVVASDLVDADTAYAIVKAVFEHLAELRRMHPAFDALEPRRMITDGISAPLHEGAARYYREQGLM